MGECEVDLLLSYILRTVDQHEHGSTWVFGGALVGRSQKYYRNSYLGVTVKGFLLSSDLQHSVLG